MSQQPVVLFSSCDQNYTKHIPTLILSAHENLPDKKIEFYLLHRNIPEQNIDLLKQFSERVNVFFQGVSVDSEDFKKFEELKKICSPESTFPAEGFLGILPNRYLPKHVERALYLDAGDVILSGDISPYYFSDFHGNILTVSKGFAPRWDYTAQDLYDRDAYLRLASEYFNSGVVLYNVELMRRLNIDFDYYISIAKKLRDMQDGYNWDTFGGGRRYVLQDDQGLLGAAFVGHINFYDPENIGNINTPYNFRPFVFECNKQNIDNVEFASIETLRPAIIHLLGNKPNTPNNVRKTLLKISRDCLSLWHKYEDQARKLKAQLV